MAMMKGAAAANPDAYVEALSGWQRPLVEMLRTAINADGCFSESIKWTNLLFSLNGPCIVLRAEEKGFYSHFFVAKGSHTWTRVSNRAGSLNSQISS